METQKLLECIESQTACISELCEHIEKQDKLIAAQADHVRRLEEKTRCCGGLTRDDVRRYVEDQNQSEKDKTIEDQKKRRQIVEQHYRDYYVTNLFVGAKDRIISEKEVRGLHIALIYANLSAEDFHRLDAILSHFADGRETKWRMDKATASRSSGEINWQERFPPICRIY